MTDPQGIPDCEVSDFRAISSALDRISSTGVGCAGERTGSNQRDRLHAQPRGVAGASRSTRCRAVRRRSAPTGSCSSSTTAATTPRRARRAPSPRACRCCAVHEPIAGLSHGAQPRRDRRRGGRLPGLDRRRRHRVPEWLRLYEAGFEAHPDAAFFAGPIRVRFEGDAAALAAASLPLVRTAYRRARSAGAARAFDAHSRRLPFGAEPGGARRGAARAYPFDLALGRHPERMVLRRRGESICSMRMARAGAHGVWLPRRRRRALDRSGTPDARVPAALLHRCRLRRQAGRAGREPTRRGLLGRLR